MAGHGSPPPQDRANHPARQVGRVEANISQTESGRWSGVVRAPGRGAMTGFNVRTEARARAAASALESMGTQERSKRGAGLSRRFGRRFLEERH